MFPTFTKFEDAEIDTHYKIQFSEKLYYNEFSYKLFLKFPSISTFRRENEKLDRLLSNYNSEDFKKRNGVPHHADINYAMLECLRVLVYTNNQEIVDKVLDMFEDKIILLAKPLNDKHHEVLKNEDKSVIRKNLFFKKYRYMVGFDRYNMIRTEEGIKRIRENIKDYFIRNNRVKELDYRFTENYEPVLYLRDINDLMMIKLMFAEFILKTESIILYNEIY